LSCHREIHPPTEALINFYLTSQSSYSRACPRNPNRRERSDCRLMQIFSAKEIALPDKCKDCPKRRSEEIKKLCIRI